MVEISALATIIGTPSTEGLALGLRGAVGLPWASLSTFGAVHVIKAMISCAIPDRLREMLGLRNVSIDSAIGLDIPAGVGKASAITDWKDISGFTAHRPNDGGSWSIRNLNQTIPHTPVGGSEIQDPASYRHYCTYAYDRTASIILSLIPTPKSGEQLRIHHFHVDTGPSQRSTRSTWELITLSASAIKLLESYALFRLGSSRLWFLTALPWCYGLVAAIVLHVLNLSQKALSLSQMDLIAGELPSPLLPGGVGKLVLNLPINIRRHPTWKVALGTGALVNTASLLWIFVILRSQPEQVVYVWVAFQVVWMLLRTVVYTVAAAESQHDGIIISESWDIASIRSRRRAVLLMMGLSKQLTTIHPRGLQSYQHDIHDAATAGKLLSQVNYTLLCELPTTSVAASMTVDIIGVIGDTVFRTMTWVAGTLDAVELYDSVLVFIACGDAICAVPSVRVLAGRPTMDPECSISSFAPRGTSAIGAPAWWVYWIPMQGHGGSQYWVHVEAEVVCGKMEGRILSSVDLHRMLQRGCWNIDCASVDEVMISLEVSRKAAAIVLNMFRDADLG